ncbi:Riboflavin kinase [Prochlorococcus marinus str. SS2]|uniref:Riboflavin biosynthesis protein n=1 Tax=Prochlorococcus marinus (strain SARG / CCMP1375 / SS120) TaxID=167539 RepID=Q7VAV6_PROMA|nr:bifunctional riboflavin kinase/FAD synthetase [Prochlorococcus marinus]AAQ00391.1 FAD synthase [Prochlorococcus marinus subsp. marinus str. CCMP1375]KGG14271.1 Riboflavin kinase [Prochlorococcus marinus str. LG]KGG22156.1 Riboflavin kinase [Prochlorococcus marinus str. SS2]KGG24526.1 Riboflavin kinase [Prochlorococcus marinus str. SS35]
MISLCSPLQARLPTALALGSFDGLHAGHRSVIKTITSNTTAVPTVVSFWPHPREVLYGESKLRLYLPSEKALLLEHLGVKQLVLVPFDLSLASLSADEFFHEILIKNLQAKQISVGANFRFGKNREGDSDKLIELGEKANIKVRVLEIIEDNQGRMSSSRIREALKDGDIKLTNSLLGRAYSFGGKVVPGKGIGRKLGWPTANLEIDGSKLLPGQGVYAVMTRASDEKSFSPAIMNLGPQPTINPHAPSATEVHVLNKQVNLKGKDLIVEPVERIRTQKKFTTLKDLSNQIELDARKAISILTQR